MKKILYTPNNTSLLLYDANTDKPFGRPDTVHLRELAGKVVLAISGDEAGRRVFAFNGDDTTKLVMSGALSIKGDDGQLHLNKNTDDPRVYKKRVFLEAPAVLNALLTHDFTVEDYKNGTILDKVDKAIEDVRRNAGFGNKYQDFYENILAVQEELFREVLKNHYGVYKGIRYALQYDPESKATYLNCTTTGLGGYLRMNTAYYHSYDFTKKVKEGDYELAYVVGKTLPTYSECKIPDPITQHDAYGDALWWLVTAYESGEESLVYTEGSVVAEGDLTRWAHTKVYVQEGEPGRFAVATNNPGAWRLKVSTVEEWFSTHNSYTEYTVPVTEGRAWADTVDGIAGLWTGGGKLVKMDNRHA